MAEVRFTAQARRHLAEIRRYSVEQHDPDMADRYFRGFNEAFALLRRHPEIGPIQSGFKPRLHGLLHRKHRIYYTYDGATVLIVGVVHTARDARALLN